MSIRPRPRDDLLDVGPYESPQFDVAVRLNTNESPYPPPEAFVARLAGAVGSVELNRYPDRRATELRAGLAELVGQPVERVFCANGSNEVLQLLLLAYGGAGRSAAVFEPTYLLHAQIARITGTLVLSTDRDSSFRVDPGHAVRFLRDEAPDVTLLCSPNNPTGMVEPRDVVNAVLAAAPGLVAVDEAYGEFAADSALELVDDHRPLVVVRTFSKAWSLAAVRLGFCVGPPWVVADLEKVALPYHLPALTQVAGRLALDWRAETDARVESIVRERERVVAALGAVAGVDVFPSGANFVLLRVVGADGHAVWEELLRRGVLVRDFSDVPRLDNCLRVTIGTTEENDAFLLALKEAVG